MHGFIDWSVESFVRWLVAAILWHSCFVIAERRPELPNGRRSPARDGGKRGGSRVSTGANNRPCSRGEQPRFLVTLRGDNPRRRSAASHVEHAGPLVNRATGERQHRRQVEPRFHGEGNRRTDLGCCIHLPSVSVDLGQGEAVSQSQQLVATRTSGPRFQRPLARRTTVPSIRLGPGGAGSV